MRLWATKRFVTAAEMSWLVPGTNVGLHFEVNQLFVHGDV
jgi:hypothetical protein